MNADFHLVESQRCDNAKEFSSLAYNFSKKIASAQEGLTKQGIDNKELGEAEKKLEGALNEYALFLKLNHTFASENRDCLKPLTHLRVNLQNVKHLKQESTLKIIEAAKNTLEGIIKEVTFQTEVVLPGKNPLAALRKESAKGEMTIKCKNGEVKAHLAVLGQLEFFKGFFRFKEAPQAKAPKEQQELEVKRHKESEVKVKGDSKIKVESSDDFHFKKLPEATIDLSQYSTESVNAFLNILYGSAAGKEISGKVLEELHDLSKFIDHEELTTYLEEQFLSKPSFDPDKNYSLKMSSEERAELSVASHLSQDKKNVDITIDCLNGDLSANSSLLEAAGVSKKVIQSLVKQGIEVPKKHMEQFLELLYTGNVNASRSDLLWLVKIAENLSFEDVKETVLRQLEKVHRGNIEAAVDTLLYYFQNIAKREAVKGNSGDSLVNFIGTLNFQNNQEIPLQKRNLLMSILEKQVAGGSIEALVSLGKCLLEGFGTTKNDPDRAFKFFEKASNHHNDAGTVELAKCYMNGALVKEDQKLAYRLFSQASKHGYLPAMYYEAECLVKGYKTGKEGMIKKADQGIEVLNQAIKKGYVPAMYLRAKIDEQEIDVWEKNNLKIIENRNSSPNEQRRIPAERSRIQKQALEAKIRAFSKGAEHGFPAACYYMAVLLYQKNDLHALDYLNKAIGKEIPNATTLLGVFYENGFGVVKDTNKAIELYKEVINKGEVFAMKNLAHLFYHAGNKDHCIKYYAQAARKGDQEAINTLNNIHQKEQQYHRFFSQAEGMPFLAELILDSVIPGNADKAFEYLKEKGDRGDVEAQKRLAHLYSEGKVVKKNPKLAFHYSLLAAKKGDVLSMYEVGKAYLRGRGTSFDSDQALLWFANCEKEPFYKKIGQISTENFLNNVEKQLQEAMCKDGFVYKIPVDLLGKQLKGFPTHKYSKEEMKLIVTFLLSGVDNISPENLLKLAAIAESEPLAKNPIREQIVKALKIQ